MTINMMMPFEERHAPKNFNDLVFASTAVRDQLALYAQRSLYKNLLLYGPYGTAKSATARVVAEERLRACGVVDGSVAQLHAVDIKGNVAHVEAHASLLLLNNYPDVEPYVIIDEVDQLSAKDHDVLP